MTTFETIKQRRSIGKMTGEMPSKEQIERILEAATHAPNHHKTEPWRFFVLGGKARVELGEIMRTSLAARMTETTSDKARALLDKEKNKPLRSPIVIVVASDYPMQPGVLDIENVEAVSAAVQNMLLTIEEMRLAAQWRTGDAAYDPHVKQWLGLAPEDHIVALVYLGYSAIPRTERRPIPFAEKTTWML
jgi:nitroreductase